eukprot:GHUV01027408.1.p1 GENE.GHUV01027408.1~~GHUV01027408.1.p1  ORF type:complete len:135 (-),score=11.00 GHUV01027408.1:449-853(-)
MDPTYVCWSVWRARAGRKDDMMHLITLKQLLYMGNVHGVIMEYQRSDCTVTASIVMRAYCCNMLQCWTCCEAGSEVPGGAFAAANRQYLHRLQLLSGTDCTYSYRSYQSTAAVVFGWHGISGASPTHACTLCAV